MKRNVLITGGAGFIGCNCAKYYIEKGDNVYIFDNLSRIGAEENIKWLKEIGKFEFVKGNVEDISQVESLFKETEIPDYIFHFAGQVAVTESVSNPRKDMEDNIVGTFNLLEMTRHYAPKAVFLYSSTNKVYGNLKNTEIKETKNKYKLKELTKGVNENNLLDFYSPYGCSKGATDQYVRDYNRIYNLKTIVFRQSCIYGYRQFGIEDQGWVAWFIISALHDKEITIYGDGKQVRDILFITDLISAFDLTIKNMEKSAGQIYNIGGGPNNQISLLELIEKMKLIMNREIRFKFSDWRPGDQLIYVSDISKAEKDFGWRPIVNADEGIKKLIEWLSNNSHLFKS